MGTVFEKLQLKDQNEIVVLNAPEVVRTGTGPIRGRKAESLIADRYCTLHGAASSQCNATFSSPGGEPRWLPR